MFSVQGRTRENLVIKPRFLLYTISYFHTKISLWLVLQPWCLWYSRTTILRFGSDGNSAIMFWYISH